MGLRTHNRAGQALIDQVESDLQDRGLKFGPDERAVLTLCADLADDVAAMRRRIHGDGWSPNGKPHPLLPNLERARMQYQRALNLLVKVLAPPPELSAHPEKVRAGQASGRVRAAKAATKR